MKTKSLRPPHAILTHQSCALALCVFFAAALVFSGCKRPPVSGKQSDPTGVYSLATVDGKPVPARVSHDGATLQVISGTFTINDDGTCKSKMVFVPPSGSEVAREVKATYTREDSRLTMKWERAGTTIGTVDGDSFTMNNEGMVLVYRR